MEDQLNNANNGNNSPNLNGHSNLPNANAQWGHPNFARGPFPIPPGLPPPPRVIMPSRPGYYNANQTSGEKIRNKQAFL